MDWIVQQVVARLRNEFKQTDLTEVNRRLSALEGREINLEVYQGGEFVGRSTGTRILRLDLQPEK